MADRRHFKNGRTATS